MGAPTGSTEVLSSVCPRDTGWRAFPAGKPLMATVAAPATDCFLMGAHDEGEGIRGGARDCWCGKSRELIGGPNAARVDLADVHPLARSRRMDGSGTIGERYVDLPGDGARSGVAPEERRGDHVGRKDRPVGRIVDDDGDGPVLRAGRRHTQPGKN